ncbi:MAG: class I SAM-dependent methyltransferase [Candidatus Omnitrophica bacterium]|nr:class I SAM-dependent methyltransferase [Candidatus Omnitrophota bacterium]MCF7877303.1 class I SAM-dependent methyltransferase [Candidatus Omnitrophota bacterium]MCF7878565.1 class I SAM-dependent methyltransferase [Candidatus Omnitrophota bacterium]MCF7892587.1 class I SAM-dependent methyltransferase [Candidatus Omnitrophota bacterium]
MDDLAKQVHQEYLEKLKFYREFGYDIEAERNFILDNARPLYGDILEVGTGKGNFTLALAKEGYRFTSVDLCAEQQKAGYLNLKYLGLDKRVDFKIANGENLNFSDNNFDLVISVNMIHHLEKFSKILDEFTRVLSFEGKIVLADFTKEGLEVIDKIHSQQGRRHRTDKVDFSEIEKYFEEKDFIIERQRDKFQKILIAYHQII